MFKIKDPDKLVSKLKYLLPFIFVNNAEACPTNPEIEAAKRFGIPPPPFGQYQDGEEDQMIECVRRCFEYCSASHNDHNKYCDMEIGAECKSPSTDPIDFPNTDLSLIVKDDLPNTGGIGEQVSLPTSDRPYSQIAAPESVLSFAIGLLFVNYLRRRRSL